MFIQRISKNDYSKIAGANLFKSLSILDTFLETLQEFENRFLKEHVRKAASAAFVHIKVKGFALKLSF